MNYINNPLHPEHQQDYILFDVVERWVKNMSIINWLDGKKTYIVALCIGLVAVANYLHWMTPETVAVLYGLLGAGGLTATRASITKSSK